jgi:oligopeptide transport system substrate-binding protein
LVFSAAALLVGLVAGCGPHGTQSTSSNTFRIAMTASPSTFDPAMVRDGPTIDLLQQIFEGLVMWTPDNKIEPALADSWTVSKDGLTYTFHMRSGVKFQDGTPVTAQDVYDSIRRCLDPGLHPTVALTYLGDIVGSDDVNSGKAKDLAGVKVIDPSTVAITIKKPKAYWIYTLTYPTAYIISKTARVSTELTADEVAAGAGTGPFRLVKYDIDQDVPLTANAQYWGGAPKIDGQQRLIVKDAGTRHSLYVAGKLDLVDEQLGDLPTDSADPSLKDQIRYFPRASTFYIALNQLALPQFKDVRVRQAFAYATDKAKIRTVALNDKMDTAEDILPEGIPGFDTTFKGIPYDPAKAKALLAAAGYPGGKGFPVIPISYREDNPMTEKIVDLVRQMWEDNLGVTVQGERTEWTLLLDKMDKGVMPCYFARWLADYLDQQDYYSVLFHSGSAENRLGYSNPQVDSLCDAADVCQDPVKRNALYRQTARILADEVPRIPIYYQKDIEMVRPNVSGLDDSLMGHLPYKHIVLAH